MKLTPLDVRHKEFHRGMRGYADAEVDEFLDTVADEFERVFKENLSLAERVEALQKQVDHYRAIESTLQKTLVSAQQSAEDMRVSAQKEAQLVLRDAEVKARDTLGAAYAARQQVEREIVLLRNAEADYRFKFRTLLEGYLKQIALDEGGARAKASQFEQQAQALREAIVAESGGGRAAGSSPVAPARPAPPEAGHATGVGGGPGAPPGPPPGNTAPGQSLRQAAVAAPGAPSRQGGAPFSAEAPAAPQGAPISPLPAVPAVAEDEDGEDTAVITGIESDVDVRPLTDEESDFFSDVDGKGGGNEFKW